MPKKFRRYKKRYRKPFSKQQVAAVKKIVQGQGEVHKIDNSYNADTSAYLSNGDVSLLTGVAVGDTDITRTGNQIWLRSIQISGDIIGDQTAVQDTLIRFILVRTKDCTGTLPAITNDILETDLVTEIRDWDHRNDHKVYMDKIIKLPLRALPASALIPIGRLNYYKRFKKPIRISYDGITAGIADCTLNHFFLAIITNQGNTFQPAFTARVRCTFTDM